MVLRWPFLWTQCCVPKMSFFFLHLVVFSVMSNDFAVMMLNDDVDGFVLGDVCP